MSETEIKKEAYINASKANSFAYDTMGNRLPNIIVNGLDYFYRTWKIYLNKKFITLSYEEFILAKIEYKEIIRLFSKLRYELTTNKSLIKLTDFYEDTKIWNDKLSNFIKENNQEPTYFDSPTLYTECYVYRSIYSFFYGSKYFKDFDIFYDIKKNGLISSEKATVLILDYTSKIEERLFEKKSTEEKEFIDFVEFSLWGNRCDLSLNTGKVFSENFNLLSDLNKQKHKILSNSTNEFYLYMKNLKCKNQIRIDFVLDNSGFELIGDLCFIEMLYRTKLIDEKNTIIYFHPKNMPWFVSDVLNHDFKWVLKFISTQLISETATNLAIRWNNLLNENKWQLQNHIFWTTCHPYCEMNNISPDLYKSLTKSDLIIFKGDLNYRKLVSDINWDYSTPFRTALKGFLPSSILSLRTIKFDVLCNINDLDLLARLSSFLNFTGEYAIINFEELKNNLN